MLRTCAGSLARPKLTAMHRRPACRRAQIKHTISSQVSRSLFSWRWPLKAASTDAETDASDPAAVAFSQLVGEREDSKVALRQSASRGRGLYTREEVPSAGDILLDVPVDKCIVVDYGRGAPLRLPPAKWPRLRKGVAKDDSLPWDVLVALALLDALAGDGDAFWAQYVNDVLPAPLQLSLPLCLPEPLLLQLGHSAIREGALQQKQRLQQLFPGLASPMCEDGPTFMQWALACVRSRAFQLSPDCFAFCPFLDVANHAAEPNADFRLSQDGREVELRALTPVAAGSEVTISYAAGERGGGYTNQRLMAQYGFVPIRGNPHDRLQFACLGKPHLDYAASHEDSGNGSSGRINSSDGAAAGTKVLLSLDALQSALGDGEVMVAAFSGRDPVLYAALKSLPLATMESDAAPLEEQLKLAERVLGEVEAERAGWSSSIGEDEAELVQVVGEASDGDSRLPAAVRYRLQRKRLVEAAAQVLRAFLHL